MADIKVVIQLQDTIEDEINSLESSSAVNNASVQKTSDVFNVLSTKSNGTNLKSWAKQTYKNGEYVGSLSLADGYVGGANTQLVEQYGYNGYVFGAVPESKQLAVTLEVVGKNIDSIIVYGDKAANQFPTKAYRDGNPNDIIYSDDPVWTIRFDQQSTSHTITFLEWNRADYNACITSVAELTNELTLDKSSIRSLESLSQSTGQPKEVYYGITPSSGQTSIIDIDGEFYDLVNEGIIKNAEVPLKVFVNDEIVGSQISLDSEYSQNKEFVIDMTDNLSRINKLYYEGYKKINESKTLYDLVVDVLGSLNPQYTAEFIDEKMLDSDIKTHLQNINYLTPYISYATYSDVINNICNVGQLQFIWDSDDHPKFVRANKQIDINENILIIPSKMQMGKPEKDIIVKNKIDCVKYNNSQIIKNIKNVFDSTSVNTKSFTSATYPISYQQNDYIRATSAGVVITQGARVEGTVAEGSFEVRKRTDVLNVYNDIDISVNGKKYTSLTYTDNLYSSSYDYEFAWESPTNSIRQYKVLAGGTPQQFSEPISNISLTYNSQSAGQQKTLSISHNNYVSIQEFEDKYVVSFRVLAYAGKFYVEAGGTTLRTGTGEINLIESMSFSIKGDVVEVRFTDVTKNIGDTSSENYYTLKQNEMLQDNATINGQNLGDYIGNDILSKFGNGISTVKITICCLDMYDTNGNKNKNWAKGEMVSIGDVVRIDKDNLGNSRYKYANGTDMYFRVTGRNFRYAGVPMLDLELQEVKLI